MSIVESTHNGAKEHFYYTFGRYPDKDEEQAWVCTVGPLLSANQLELPPELENHMFMQCAGYFAAEVGITYLQLLDLIDDIAVKYIERDANFRNGMQLVRLGDMIPKEYDGYHKLMLTALVCTRVDKLYRLAKQRESTG
jgi:hypothetical protein